MNRLQLATLLSWAGERGLQGRKRLQKVVYFLQKAGCPLDCQYTLHHFGPYSRDVADACDEMVAAGLVDETGGPQNGAMQYTYALKPHTQDLLSRVPENPLQKFQDLGRELITKDIKPLELGSTILFFYEQSQDWMDALTKACEFKNVPINGPESQAALQLAKDVLAHQ